MRTWHARRAGNVIIELLTCRNQIMRSQLGMILVSSVFMPLSVSAKDIDLRLQFVGTPTLNLNSGTLQLVFDQNNSPGAPANPSLRRIVNVPMNRNDTADQIMQRAVVLLDQIPEFNGKFTLQQGPPPGIVASLPRVTAFRYRPIPNNPGERLINTSITPKIRNTRPPVSYTHLTLPTKA